MWQIIRMQLMASINLKNHPELVRLLEDGEDLQDLLSLPPEDVLIRWVNYHMKAAGNPRRLTKNNFGKDMKDSELYTVLLNQIDSRACDLKALEVDGNKKRAPHVLRNAGQLPPAHGGEKLVPIIDADVISSGNKRLNYAFLAQIFNHNPGYAWHPLQPLLRSTHCENFWFGALWLTIACLRPCAAGLHRQRTLMPRRCWRMAKALARSAYSACG